MKTILNDGTSWGVEADKIIDHFDNILSDTDNLFREDYIVEEKYLNAADGSLVSSALYNCINMHPIEAEKEYSLYSTVGLSVFSGYVFFFDNTNTFISNTVLGSGINTFTTPANTAYFGRSAAVANLTLEQFRTTVILKRGKVESGYIPTKKINEQIADKTETIDINSTQSLLLIGTSFTEGFGSVKDKAFPSYLSALIDWNVVNYGVSGSNYIKHLNYFLNDNTFNGVQPSDLNGGVCLDFLAGNAENPYFSNGLDANNYEDNIYRLYSLLMAKGFEPIAGSYFGFQPNPIGIVQRNVCKSLGLKHISINKACDNVTQRDYVPHFYSDHFASRTNALQWYNLLKVLNVGRPRTAMKIFRNRKASATLSNFLFDNNTEKMEWWREISLSHKAISTGNEEYVDRLDQLVYDEVALDSVGDEYIAFKNGTALTFPDKALIEFVLPATSNHIENLKINITNDDIGATYYLKKYVDSTMVVDLTDSTAIFTLDSVPGDISVADEFTDTNNVGVTFTVISVESDVVTCSADDTFTSPGATTGTLTRVSDSATYAYSHLISGASTDYLSNVFSKKSIWEEVDILDGTIRIPTPSNYMYYDKISLFIVGSGSFDLSAISCTFNKPVAEKNDLQFVVSSLNDADFSSSDILTENSFDNVGGVSDWTLTNTSGNSALKTGDVSYTAADGVTPATQNQIPDYYTNLGVTKILHLRQGDSVKQDVDILNSSDGNKTYKLKLVARYYPDECLDIVSDTPQIDSTTFDFARISVKIFMKDSDSYFSKTFYVPLNFVEIEYEMYFDSKTTLVTNTIEITAIDDKIDLLYCEVLE